MDLFKDIIASINMKDGNILDENPMDESEYLPYIVNRNFSFGSDTILYSNEMNRLHFLDHKKQYDFYYYLLDKRKRWNKWIKNDQTPEYINTLEIVQNYYNCSHKKAQEYMKYLSESDIDEIVKLSDTGGKQ